MQQTLQKGKKKYYENLDPTKVTDNRESWKSAKPFLSDKIKYTQKICFKDGDKVISYVAVEKATQPSTLY